MERHELTTSTLSAWSWRWTSDGQQTHGQSMCASLRSLECIPERDKYAGHKSNVQAPRRARAQRSRQQETAHEFPHHRQYWPSLSRCRADIPSALPETVLRVCRGKRSVSASRSSMSAPAGAGTARARARRPPRWYSARGLGSMRRRPSASRAVTSRAENTRRGRCVSARDGAVQEGREDGASVAKTPE